MSTSPSFRSRKLILILILLIGGITVSAVSGTNSFFSQVGFTAGAFFSSELSSTTPADPNPGSMPLALLPTPTPIPLTAVDDAGPDDEPGQKDLNFLTVDYNPPTAGTINVIWGWDDTGTSGANTLDACSLFDTDSDGKANYSFCMIINSDNSYSTVLYSCGDGATDKCTNPRAPIVGATSNGTFSRPANSDPFGWSGSPDFTASHLANNACKFNPACNTTDTKADTNIKLSEVGGGSAFLLNVCSYPSGIPGSDPSDCVFTPNSGFLTIVKVADPDDETNFVFNSTEAAQNDDTSWTIQGSGSVEIISFAPTTTIDLSEVVPDGWELDSASCVLNGSATGTPTSTGVDNFTIQSGLVTVCTFNDSLAQGTLKLVKVVNNLGNSGPDYKGVSDFPLFIDGNATTSEAVVTVAAGDHTISETSQFGYDVGRWSCNDGTLGTLGSASATVNVASGEDVICTMVNTVNDDILNPQLSIVKSDNDATYDEAGDVITYSIVATNTGNTNLTGVTITDALATLGTCTPANGSPLAPGESITCSATHTITQADVDAGSYLNTACVDDNVSGSAGAAQACDDETTPGSKNPELSISKVATESGYDSVGDVIHYTIVATNTGNVTLSNVTITDTQVSDLSCTPNIPVASLAPGATITCTASHTITQADLDAGSFYNQACVNDGPNGAAQVCDDVTTPGTKNPHLSITKVASEASYDSVGDVIHYTIVATNDGNVTLAGVTVIDPNVSDLVCTPANGSALAPGESLNCTASHVVTQADIDAGHYANTSCVDDGPQGAPQACDSEDVPGDQNPHLSITKVAAEETYDSVGDVINYTIIATNDGNVTLHNVLVSDPGVSDLQCSPGNPVASLAPGGTITCTASHTISQADIDAGHYANTSCVDDGAGGAAEACDSEDVPGAQNPHLTIVKGDSNATYDSVGDVINYTIVATNDGNVTLHNVLVTDPQVSDLVCDPSNPVADLAPGASITCTASHAVTQADLDAGSYLNTACVNDGDGGAAEACDDESTPGTQNPHLTITKDDDVDSYDSVGDVIHYTIVATNDGNVTLNSVTVTDPKADGLTCTPANGSSLAPGQSMNCTASHTVTQADIDAGSFNNAACVNDGPDGAAEACDDVTTPGDRNPHLSITKTADPQTYDSVGDVINYTIVATNDGNVTLNVVTVSDPNVSNLQCTPANGSSLAPGASMTCTASHTIVQADLDAGHYANTSCVDDGPDGAAQACDTEDVPGGGTPGLTITKVATEQNYDSVGDIIHYTIVATNNGALTLHNVSVSDPNVSNLVCDPATPVADFAPGATITCTATHTVTQADITAGHYANTACVDDNGGPATQACDSEDVPAIQTPRIDLVKSATPSFSNPPVAGNTILYSFVITNTGNVPLTGVDLTDSLLGYNDVTCGGVTSLAPGASTNCSGTYTLTQADVNAGTVSNTATACGDPPTGNEVCDNDGTTTPITRSPSLTVDKSADLTLITAAGEVVTYTYVVRNTGNVTLTNVTLTDNKIPGTISCSPAQPATLLPGGTMNCSATYTVTTADLSLTNLVNIATADSQQTDPATDSVSIPVQPPLKGHIMHTGVTCSDFVSNNPSDELASAEYVTKSGKVNNVAPGVMFYYATITAPSANFTYNLLQSNDAGWKPVPVQAVNQIILYESNCSKSNKGRASYNATTGTATLTVTNATSGGTYIVGVKYSLSGLAGQIVDPPLETATYSFWANFNGGATIPSSQDSIPIFPKAP